MQKKILVVGGHQTPALAMIDYLRDNSSGDRFSFVWVGREWSQRKNGQKAHEREAAQKRSIRFYPLESGKSGEAPWQTFIGVRKAYKRARAIIKAEQPDLVLSFGGFLAVPVAWAAYKLKVRVITHEQTRVLGMANRIITRWVTALALSYKNTKEVNWPKLEKKIKVVVTGNPIRDILFKPNDEAPAWWPSVPIKKPVLYISGGSQGAQAVNQAIMEIIAELTDEYLVVHQVGAATKLHSYTSEYMEMAQKKGAVMPNYFVRPFIYEDELRFLYPRVNLAISRAGANSVAELASFKIPTLYIPLPQANYDEQRLNAEYYVRKEAALILNQQSLNKENLRDKIKELKKRADEFRANLEKAPAPIEANQKMFNLILGILDD